MTIDPKASLSGIPLLKIRDFLRRDPFGLWTAEHFKDAFKLSQRQTSALLAVLSRKGYIEKELEWHEPQHWKSTELGAKLASAHAGRPISRRTADQKLAELISQMSHKVDR